MDHADLDLLPADHDRPAGETRRVTAGGPGRCGGRAGAARAPQPGPGFLLDGNLALDEMVNCGGTPPRRRRAWLSSCLRRVTGCAESQTRAVHAGFARLRNSAR
jgi:hypothetical protein